MTDGNLGIGHCPGSERGLDIREPEKLDELAELIVRIFLPGDSGES